MCYHVTSSGTLRIPSVAMGMSERWPQCSHDMFLSLLKCFLTFGSVSQACISSLLPPHPHSHLLYRVRHFFKDPWFLSVKSINKTKPTKIFGFTRPVVEKKARNVEHTYIYVHACTCLFLDLIVI